MKLCVLLLLLGMAAVGQAAWTKPGFCRAKDCPRFEMVGSN
jgi:hypothetical protein